MPVLLLSAHWADKIQRAVRKIRTGSDSDLPKIHLQEVEVETAQAVILRQLRFWLVAIAPSSDFVLPSLLCSISQLSIDSSDRGVQLE